MFNNSHHLDLRNGNFSNVGGNSHTYHVYHGSPNGTPAQSPNGGMNTAPDNAQRTWGEYDTSRNPRRPAPNTAQRAQEEIDIAQTPVEVTAEPAIRANDGPGIYLLSLDGGGIRGLSELVILDEIMNRIKHDEKLKEKPRPCDYFDIIGGTSTGGLIALMLGRLRMSTDEAILKYSSLAGYIFSERKWFFQDGLFKATRLEEAVKEIVPSNDSELMYDSLPPERMCRAFVCAAPAHNLATEGPQLFRTYEAREHRSYNCEIWKAARATSAAPTFFKRIKIGDPGSEQEYIDAGVGCNNPVWQVHHEAAAVFRSRCVVCMVSIGTGKPETVALRSPNFFQRLIPTHLIKVLKGIATDCENVAEEYRKQNRTGYFRFSVDRGMEKISLEEWQKLGIVRQHTEQYLRNSNVSKDVDAVVEILRKRPRRS